MCFAPQRRAIVHLSSGQLAPHPPALASLLFDPPEPQIIGKTQCFATFLPFRVSASAFFWLFLFSDLLSSSLLFSLPLPSSAFHLSMLSEVWLLNFLRLLLFWMFKGLHRYELDPCMLAPPHGAPETAGWPGKNDKVHAYYVILCQSICHIQDQNCADILWHSPPSGPRPGWPWGHHQRWHSPSRGSSWIRIEKSRKVEITINVQANIANTHTHTRACISWYIYIYIYIDICIITVCGVYIYIYTCIVYNIYVCISLSLCPIINMSNPKKNFRCIYIYIYI